MRTDNSGTGFANLGRVLQIRDEQARPLQCAVLGCFLLECLARMGEGGVVFPTPSFKHLQIAGRASPYPTVCRIAFKLSFQSASIQSHFNRVMFQTRHVRKECVNFDTADKLFFKKVSKINILIVYIIKIFVAGVKTFLHLYVTITV